MWVTVVGFSARLGFQPLVDFPTNQNVSLPSHGIDRERLGVAEFVPLMFGQFDHDFFPSEPSLARRAQIRSSTGNLYKIIDRPRLLALIELRLIRYHFSFDCLYFIVDSLRLISASAIGLRRSCYSFFFGV